MHNRLSFSLSDFEHIPNLISISITRFDKVMPSLIHSHPACEIIFVKESNGILKTLERDIKINKGDIVLINHNVPHTEFQEKNAVPLEYFVIMLENIEFKNFKDYDNDSNAENSVFILSTDNKEYKFYLNLFEDIFNEINEQKTYYTNCTIGYLNILIANLIRKGELSHSIINSSALPSSSISDYVKIYIDNYYANSFKIRELAKKISVSHSYLCAKFKHEFGLSPLEYKLKKQIAEAQSMLKNTDFRITQIALQTGFNNTAYFSKIFKEKSNCTPKEYRQAFRKIKFKDINTP